MRAHRHGRHPARPCALPLPVGTGARHCNCHAVPKSSGPSYDAANGRGRPPPRPQGRSAHGGWAADPPPRRHLHIDVEIEACAAACIHQATAPSPRSLRRRACCRGAPYRRGGGGQATGMFRSSHPCRPLEGPMGRKSGSIAARRLGQTGRYARGRWFAARPRLGFDRSAESCSLGVSFLGKQPAA